MLAARAQRSGQPAQPTDWLFESIEGGRPLNRDNFRKYVMRPALERAGLPDHFRTYDLRHAHASMLIDAGASPLDVAHRMGHSDPAVTLRNYGHLFEGRQEELTEHLDALRRASAPVERAVIAFDARDTVATHRDTKRGQNTVNSGKRRTARIGAPTRTKAV